MTRSTRAVLALICASLAAMLVLWIVKMDLPVRRGEVILDGPNPETGRIEGVMISDVELGTRIGMAAVFAAAAIWLGVGAWKKAS